MRNPWLSQSEGTTVAAEAEKFIRDERAKNRPTTLKSVQGHLEDRFGPAKGLRAIARRVHKRLTPELGLRAKQQ